MLKKIKIKWFLKIMLLKLGFIWSNFWFVNKTSFIKAVDCECWADPTYMYIFSSGDLPCKYVFKSSNCLDKRISEFLEVSAFFGLNAKPTIAK